MAYISAQKSGFSITALLARPFLAVFNGLIALAESQPRMIAVEKLGQKTDAELAALGTTRDAEIRRIFGGFYHI
jgi:hypothetical protein